MHSEANALDGGFANPVFDAQATFRAIMDAMARPATVRPAHPCTLPPAPLQALAGAVACTLIDADTPVWLDDALSSGGALHAWLAFHTNARLVDVAAEAAFALIGRPAAMPPLDHFAQGTQDYPDRSATLVLQVEAFEGGAPLTFRGPGIKGAASIAPTGLPGNFARQWSDNRRRFPRGVDLILVAGAAIACLPRSACLVEGGE